MAESILKLEDISKSFGETDVLRHISVDIRKGEFITFLGASGCGKTTMLRIIAGLETPETGRVVLEGADVTDAAPDRRNVNTVFQNYALFPHMNVYDNIAYSLKIRGVDKQEIKRRVGEALELVKLPGYEKRSPTQLSGGQRQRVAIARATVNRPGVLLLDEPLGALDLALRRQMQTELKKMQQQLGITFVYITHDQEEAINMSDRIVVMREGRIEQLGSPAEIYDHPKTGFVAQFIGTANIFDGVARSARASEAEVELNGTVVGVSTRRGISDGDFYRLEAGRGVRFMIRSESVVMSRAASANTPLEAAVLENNYAGGQLRTVLRLAGGQTVISSRYGKGLNIEAGQTVYIGWEPENSALIDMEAADEKE